MDGERFLEPSTNAGDLSSVDGGKRLSEMSIGVGIEVVILPGPDRVVPRHTANLSTLGHSRPVRDCRGRGSARSAVPPVCTR